MKILNCYYLLFVLIAFINATISSCDQPDSANVDPAEVAADGDADDSAADDAGNTEATDTLGSLAIGTAASEAYPVGLNVTAFPTTLDDTLPSASAGAILIGAALVDVNAPAQGNGINPTNGTGQPSGGEPDPSAKHPEKKIQEAADRLKGTATNCFPSELEQAISAQDVKQAEKCYEFDEGFTQLGIDANGTVVGVGDHNWAVNTVTEPDTSGEACVVGFTRHEMKKTASKVEIGLMLTEGMLCQSEKDGTSDQFPANAGDEMDFTDSLSTNFNGVNRTWTKALITRLLDKNSRPVYKTEVVWTEPMNQSETRTTTFKMFHSPSAEGNKNYSGVIQILNSPLGSGDESKFNNAISVRYERTGTELLPNLRYEIREGRPSFQSTPFSDGLADLNSGADSNNQFPNGSEVSGIKYFAFDGDPLNFVGKVAYFRNPGSSYTEAARGFLFEIGQGTDGKLIGCAVAGAARTSSIRKAVKEGVSLKIDGCYTPRSSDGYCGNSGNNQGPEGAVQCFSQNADGRYVIDASKTTSAAGFDIVADATTITQPTFDMSDMDTFTE